MRNEGQMKRIAIACAVALFASAPAALGDVYVFDGGESEDLSLTAEQAQENGEFERELAEPGAELQLEDGSWVVVTPDRSTVVEARVFKAHRRHHHHHHHRRHRR